MPVISTRRARHRPIAAPPAMATMISPTAAASRLRAASPTVAARAIAMPAMPKALPDLAVSCRDSPARLSTNSSAATT
jgi:hypothetical protein